MKTEKPLSDKQPEGTGEPESNYERPAIIIRVPRAADQLDSGEFENDSTRHGSPAFHGLWQWMRAHVSPMNILTFMIAAAAWAQFSVTQGQLETMNRQLNQMQSSGKGSSAEADRIIENMNWLAKEAHHSVQEAHRALEVTNEQSQKSLGASISASRTDQRAWIDFTIDAPPYFQADKSITTHAEMKNLGKTPARNIRAGWIFMGIPSGEHIRFDDSRLPMVRFGMLPPQGAARLPVEIVRNQPDTQLGASRFEGIKSGDIVVYFWGLIRYDDIFGYAHWLQFCYAFNPAHATFHLTSVHNEIDNERR